MGNAQIKDANSSFDPFLIHNSPHSKVTLTLLSHHQSPKKHQSKSHSINKPFANIINSKLQDQPEKPRDTLATDKDAQAVHAAFASLKWNMQHSINTFDSSVLLQTEFLDYYKTSLDEAIKAVGMPGVSMHKKSKGARIEHIIASTKKTAIRIVEAGKSHVGGNDKGGNKVVVQSDTYRGPHSLPSDVSHVAIAMSSKERERSRRPSTTLSKISEKIIQAPSPSIANEQSRSKINPSPSETMTTRTKETKVSDPNVPSTLKSLPRLQKKSAQESEVTLVHSSLEDLSKSQDSPQIDKTNKIDSHPKIKKSEERVGNGVTLSRKLSSKSNTNMNSSPEKTVAERSQNTEPSDNKSTNKPQNPTKQNNSKSTHKSTPKKLNKKSSKPDLKEKSDNGQKSDTEIKSKKARRLRYKTKSLRNGNYICFFCEYEFFYSRLYVQAVK